MAKSARDSKWAVVREFLKIRFIAMADGAAGKWINPADTDDEFMEDVDLCVTMGGEAFCRYLCAVQGLVGQQDDDPKYLWAIYNVDQWSTIGGLLDLLNGSIGDRLIEQFWREAKP